MAGVFAGLLLPVMLVLAGWLFEILVQASAGLPNRVAIGPLGIETSWLNADGNRLRAVAGLIVLIVITALLTCVTVITNYRAAALAAIDFHTQVQHLLFRKSGLLAVDQGLAGQLAALHRMQQSSLPKSRESIRQWYSVFPRHFIYVVALLCLSMMIHFGLTVLFAVCLLILRAIFNHQDASWRKHRPVLVERARAATQQLSYLCETAPLLATVHDHQDTVSGFETQLSTFRQSNIHLIHAGPWRSPLLLIVAIAFSTFIGSIIAIRVLEPDPKYALRIGEAMTLCVAMLLLVGSLSKMWKAYVATKASEPLFHAIFEYLEQPTLENSDESKLEPKGISQQLAFDHVTLKDSSGQKLLEDITLILKPGQITAIFSSDSVQAGALAELVLGFGRPTSGRVLIDSTDSIDINRKSMLKQSLWINPSGPLVNGSIESNLWPDGHSNATLDLMEITKRVRVSEAVLNLADGLATMVTPGDDRLQPDHLFRLGIARGLLKKPSIVIAEEPSNRVKPSTESDTLAALQELKREGAVIVLIPNRPASLRIADQVVVIHEHKVADVGNHAELLARSELYRHLNYIRFTQL